MSKTLKQLLSFVLVAAMVLSFAACSAKKDENTLVVWNSITTEADKEKPENEWFFNKMCKAFEDANPGVKIKVIYESDQAAAQNKLKAAVLGKNAPDIVNTYAGYTVTTLSDALQDITQYIPKEDMEKITGWETLSKDSKLGNPIYGYPGRGNELGLMFYNKELVAAAGVDLEGEGAPKNAQEFKAALQKIKDSGVLPITGVGNPYSTLFIFGAGSWWTQQVGPEVVTSNSLGTTKFADDEAFIEVCDFMYELYADGLLNEDWASAADPSAAFYNGEAAMMPDGNWSIAYALEMMGDKLGVYFVPDFDDDVLYEDAAIGGIGQAYCVTSSCKNPELATKFLSFISSKENCIAWAKESSSIPHRTDVTAADMGWEGIEVYEKALTQAQGNLLPWNDNGMEASVMNEYYKITGSVTVGDMTGAEAAEMLDKTAEMAKENASAGN